MCVHIYTHVHTYICIYMYIYIHSVSDYFSLSVLQNIKYSSLCYRVGPFLCSDSKVSACNAGDPGSIPGLGRSSGEGNGSPLQYSCLENSVDGGT